MCAYPCFGHEVGALATVTLTVLEHPGLGAEKSNTLRGGDACEGKCEQLEEAGDKVVEG
jgi:hypothetical protein